MNEADDIVDIEDNISQEHKSLSRRSEHIQKNKI